jgi:hypothetical protein
LQKWYAKFIVDRWESAHRLASYVRASTNVNLFIIHSKRDFEIQWKHADALFYAAANATSAEGMTIKQMDDSKIMKDQGEAGWLYTWNAGRKKISEQILLHGGECRALQHWDVARMLRLG